jgi:hypothetical protein
MAFVDLIKLLDAPLTSLALSLALRRFGNRHGGRLRLGLIVDHALFLDPSAHWTSRRPAHRFASFESRIDDHELPLEQSLDRLPQILQQMPSIENLPCARSSVDDRLSISRPAIAADEFDTGMIVEPLLYGVCITIGKKINDATSHKIHDDGSVPLALEPGPVVDPNDPRLRGFACELLDTSKERVWARRHCEEGAEAGSRFTTKSKSEGTVRLAKPVGRPSIWLSKPREALTEDPARALGMRTKKPSNREFKTDRPTEAR